MGKLVSSLLKLRGSDTHNIDSGRVSRVVAAKHLAPITLELGDKNHVYNATCNLPLVLHQLLWGKTGNTGQVCITRDYVPVR